MFVSERNRSTLRNYFMVIKEENVNVSVAPGKHLPEED